jgi:hypothetical protein
MSQYEALVWIVVTVCSTIIAVCYLYTTIRIAEGPPSQPEEYAGKAEMDDDWP